MSYPNLYLAQSVARERERDTLRTLDHRKAQAQRSSVRQEAPRPVLAPRWHDVLVHLHLSAGTARRAVALAAAVVLAGTVLTACGETAGADTATARHAAALQLKRAVEVRDEAALRREVVDRRLQAEEDRFVQRRAQLDRTGADLDPRTHRWVE